MSLSHTSQQCHPGFQWATCLQTQHYCTWTQTTSDLAFFLSPAATKFCSEWRSCVITKQRLWHFCSLKNTIRMKAMINTHNWNKWQLTAETNLPSVGRRDCWLEFPIKWLPKERYRSLSLITWMLFGGQRRSFGLCFTCMLHHKMAGFKVRWIFWV